MSNSQTFYIGLDVGGTNVRAAVCDNSGNVYQRLQQQLDFSKLTTLNNDIAIEYIVNNIASFVTRLKQSMPNKQINGVGIGFPGFFQHGILLASPNIAQLNNVPLAALLQEHIGLTIVVENDALCAAFGEYTYGAGRGYNCFTHITLGTGVGGGLIANGQPFAGAHGMSMEVGHLTVNATKDALLCGCGNKGCLEAYASATAIVVAYCQHKNKADLVPTANDIYVLATQGDALAQQVFAKAGANLGFALAQISNLLDTDCISLGGGMAAAWEYFAPTMQNVLHSHLIPPHRTKLQLLPAQLGDDAGIIGAAALAAR